MKKLLTFIAALVLTVAAHAQSTNALSEVTIYTLPSTNLNATRLRITIQSVHFDAQNWIAIPTYSIEAWSSEVEDGKTNDVIIAKRSLTPTVAQLKALANSPDPKAVFKASILARAKLTEKQ